MIQESTAHQQWEAEGSTPEEAQAVQDARMEHGVVQARLVELTKEIAALQVIFEDEDDEDARAELGAALTGLQTEQAELEASIAGIEKDFTERGVSADMPTLQ